MTNTGGSWRFLMSGRVVQDEGPINRLEVEFKGVRR